jgi:hypothetical protein
MRGFLIVACAGGGIGCGGAPIAVRPTTLTAPAKSTSATRAPLDPIAALSERDHEWSWIVPGLAQLDLGGPTVHAPSGASELAVELLDEQATMVRVAVWADHGLDFAVWTERARLLGIVKRDQYVATHPGGGDVFVYGADPIAVVLHANARVRQLGHKDGWTQVRYLGSIEVDGWLPDDAIGERTASDMASTLGRIPTGRPTLMVTPGTVIRTEPQWSARELAVTANGYFLDEIKNIDDAWAEAGYEDGDVRVHGFLSRHDPPGRVHKPPEPDTTPDTIQPTATIPIGTCLYSGEHGEMIGFVVEPTPGELDVGHAQGWYDVAFDTVWGPLTFAVQGVTDHDLVACEPASMLPPPPAPPTP